MKKDIINEKLLSIWVVIVFALAIRFLLYGPHPPFWDGAVYVLMGKYIFSGGAIGLIEPFRPIVWPFILGSIWKLGLDPVIFGKILELIFSLGTIFLVYLIGEKIYGKNTGLLAALLLSLSPTFYFWGNFLYSGIPASFFGLLTVFLFFNRKPVLSGALGAISIFTKFTQVIPNIIIGFFYSFGGNKSKASLRSIRFLVALTTGIIIFSIGYILLYKNILDVIWQAKTTYGQIRFNWLAGIARCIKSLFDIESFVFIFIPVGLFFLKKKDSNKKKLTLALIGILLFAWVGKLQTNIIRFFISALPYLYLLSAEGIIQALRISKKRGAIFYYSVIMICVFALGLQAYRICTMKFPENKLTDFQRYVIRNEENIKGNIWISDPLTFLYSDIKPDELMYYPVFDKNKIDNLMTKINTADYIFYDTRALLCRPQNDILCQKKKKTLNSYLINNFKADIILRDTSGTFAGGIFRSIENSK